MTVAVGEVQMWRRKGLQEDNQILQKTTLSVPTASSENFFSTLRKLKLYLRNSVSENHLNGLPLLAVHQVTEVDPE
ncbi:hypothetical protein PR048_011717 [Dryococelus australis]|uniref:HAT C-terminal dimerisation domain-containing protein n=1 Tax=Dryococelus australis TaxID=614101 RepID=A0ABQ9HMZ5_9NEOP|nr:hypothetical protein PR048_011717 [Dryococelus australis]